MTQFQHVIILSFDISNLYIAYRAKETAPKKFRSESVIVENDKLNFISNRCLVLLIVNIPTLRGPMLPLIVHGLYLETLAVWRIAQIHL